MARWPFRRVCVPPLPCAGGDGRGNVSYHCTGGGTMNELVRQTIAFVQENQGWAPTILFALAFCESFAFIAVWAPFVSILLAVGALLGASGLPLWPAWFGAVVGAFAAQWLAYEMAFRFKGRVMRFWPLSRNEAWVARGV